MKKYVLVIVTLLLIMSFRLFGAELRLIKSIGDERDDYTFFAISKAAMSENKDTYILDVKGLFLAKYDWSGKFIKRLGQKGAGPADFNYPRFLDIYKNKLVVLDFGNRRIAETGLDMEKFDYYKFTANTRFDNVVFPLPEGNFLGVFGNLRDNTGRIGVIDKESNVIRSFFNELPIQLDTDNAVELGKKKDTNSRIRNIIFSQETKPFIGVDVDRKEILVSFFKPDNPIKFFVYTIDGRRVKTFSYKLDEKYKFFDFYVKAKSHEDISSTGKFPKKHSYPVIQGLFIFHDHYIAVLRLFDYVKKEKEKSTPYLLIFNREGKLKEKMLLDSNLGILNISREGYVLATKWDEDVTKLYIYKLEL